MCDGVRKVSVSLNVLICTHGGNSDIFQVTQVVDIIRLNLSGSSCTFKKRVQCN